MKIGKQEFEIGKRTYIMGILNITPDSFSDGGHYLSIDKALDQVKKMLEDGADIIDIGGESTRPGHKEVTSEEEIQRVVPIIEAIRQMSDVPISIDTSKALVAEKAIQSGANLVNDVWGFKKDSNLAKIVAKYQVACCLMHNKTNTVYTNLIEDIKNELMESISIAQAAGISKGKIILDPGIGFVKNLAQNIETMKQLEAFKEMGYPLLLGTSRKSMIGLTLDLPVTERLEGTLATTAIGIMKGCDFVRVHDVKENKRVALMTDAIIRGCDKNQ